MITKTLQSEVLTIQYSYYRPITENLKREINRRLKLISTKTIMGFVLHDFFINANFKTDEDYRQLLNELYTYLHDGPLTMKQILGINFYFFQELLA